MKFPKELATVTPLSRKIAIVVLISLIIIGFGLGIRYQETIDLQKQNNTAASAIVKPTTPTADDRNVPNVVRLAQEDLAKRVGTNAKNIKLVSVAEEKWSDASLGCPNPAMFYAQVITPGYKAVFSHDQKQYAYHTDKTQRFFVCK